MSKGLGTAVLVLVVFWLASCGQSANTTTSQPPSYFRIVDAVNSGSSYAYAPSIIVKDGTYHAGYGAGQTSVVVQNGKLLMWYSYDSLFVGGQPNLQTFMLESTDPVTWTQTLAARQTCLTSARLTSSTIHPQGNS